MLKIEFTTKNAAFDGDGLRTETARLLRNLAESIESIEDYGFMMAQRSGSIRDVNGNVIGAYSLTR
jgi:hypothetical protein